jgi:pimeloyl-ACP methyl ester carboxylesterase
MLVASAGGLASAADLKHGYMTSSDGIKIHYVEVGEGIPVILIHGAMGSAEGNWFSNGIGQALAVNHRVVAIDLRDHGKSESPSPNSKRSSESSRPNSQRYYERQAQDVIELMDFLGIQKAHFQGYSMGGGIVESLLAMVPNRFLTAGFGGWGVREVDPEWKAKIPPDTEERDPQEAEAWAAIRARRAQDKGMTLEELEAQEQRARAERARTGASADGGVQPVGPIDLSKITIPVIAINGELDRPNFKTVRMTRELSNFKSVVLPGKSHLTAIMAGYMPKAYLDSTVEFINANDPK